MNKIKKVQQGDVNITSPHFLISYSHEMDSAWHSIALLSSAPSADEIALQILGDFESNIITLMENEIDFYLFRLKNPNPISYLIYHCSTLSNLAYSNIHFSYVENITLSNLTYYVNTRCKQLGIHNNFLHHSLEENFASMVTFYLIGVANNDDFINKLHTEDYEYNIRLLQRSLSKLSDKDNLSLEKINYMELCKYIRNMNLKNCCQFLNLLNHLNIIKNKKQLTSKHLTSLMYFYYVNSKELQKIRSE